jgi:hypothetical protein
MKTQDTHWFFTNSNALTIYVYGLGDHPSITYNFNCRENFENKMQALKQDGYEFIKDQAV